MTLSFAPEAARDLAEAADFYAQAKPDLDAAFLAAVRATFQRILERPAGGLRVKAVKDCRRWPVRRFPYTVVHLDWPDEVRILAVGHDRREPGFWRGRR